MDAVIIVSFSKCAVQEFGYPAKLRIRYRAAVEEQLSCRQITKRLNESKTPTPSGKIKSDKIKLLNGLRFPPLHPSEVFDHDYQLGLVRRFGDMHLEARAHRTQPVLVPGERRQRDSRNPL
jgi:hypothetical protein